MRKVCLILMANGGILALGFSNSFIFQTKPSPSFLRLEKRCRKKYLAHETVELAPDDGRATIAKKKSEEDYDYSESVLPINNDISILGAGTSSITKSGVSLTDSSTNGVSWTVHINGDDTSASAIPISKRKFLIHKGRSAAMIRRSPCIAGVTLCKGWNQEATKTFVQSVNALVDLNPILSGRVYEKTKNLWEPRELWIQSGTFDPRSHNFVNKIELPDSLSIPNLEQMNATEIQTFLETDIFPLLDGCELTSKQIESKLPLLSTSLIELPGGYAVYSLKMSHAVGDGVTFFQLIKQLSLLMSGLKVPPIDWDCPAKATHEFYPDTFSKKDVEISYGIPFMLGLLRNIPYMGTRKQNIILLSKKQISKLKRELRTSLNCSDLSSNDVITAALCEANRSSDIFVFTENARGIKDGISRNTGGNLFWEIPVSRKCCAHPEQFRRQQNLINLAVGSHGLLNSDKNNTNQQARDDVVKKNVAKGLIYKRDHLPIEPFLFGRVGRLTSLASITEKVVLEGTEIVCTLPFLSFIAEIPMDVAVVFRFNNDYWGVLHNFSNLKIRDKSLLSQIL